MQVLALTLETSDAFISYFNLSEAALWFTISAVLLFKWLKAPKAKAKAKPFSVALPVAFFFFGISDVIEAKTLAWWDPWWLLALKTVCVLTFLVCAVQHFRKRKK